MLKSRWWTELVRILLEYFFSLFCKCTTMHGIQHHRLFREDMTKKEMKRGGAFLSQWWCTSSKCWTVYSIGIPSSKLVCPWQLHRCGEKKKRSEKVVRKGRDIFELRRGFKLIFLASSCLKWSLWIKSSIFGLMALKAERFWELQQLLSTKESRLTTTARELVGGGVTLVEHRCKKKGKKWKKEREKRKTWEKQQKKDFSVTVNYYYFILPLLTPYYYISRKFQIFLGTSALECFRSQVFTCFSNANSLRGDFLI